MKKILVIATIILAVALAAYWLYTTNGGKPEYQQSEINVAKNGKALIVFFSHAGDNTRVGNIEVGNTKILADYVKDITGADQFEVVPLKDYNMSYRDLTKLAKQELESGEKPPYKGRVDSLEQYKTIFVGTPIWWNTFPQVMFSFFDDHNLNGKLIVPFTTHEGSKLGRVVTDLQRLFPDATITGAFTMRGQDVRTGRADVEEWLRSLGYTIK